jgi:hypothetical protein
VKRFPPLNPFDSSRLIGTVFEIEPASARVVLSTLDPKLVEVGKFAVIDCNGTVLFARISTVSSPQHLDGHAVSNHDSAGSATATIDLMTTIDVDGGNAMRGIQAYPHPDSRVYGAPPELLQWLFECNQARVTGDEDKPIMLNLISLGDGIEVGLSPERAFGRHCAVLGATGVGKSWTLAKLLEEASHYSSKMILVDSSGEYHTFAMPGARHVHIGADPSGREQVDEVAMPYFDLTESDMFALFKPTGPTQPVKLRAAIKSLKLVRVPHLSSGGVIMKAGKLKAPFEAAMIAKARELNDPRANFDITKLPAQIDAECVFPVGGFASQPDPTRFGAPNELERSNCINLITRIEDMLNAPELACVFRPGKTRPIFDEIDNFIEDSEARVLRISLKFLPFSHDAREIIANALGRRMLDMARRGRFDNSPLVLVLDEAHYFLNREFNEDTSIDGLNSFELIAKEGRKLSLCFCLATQRPRDIPEGILSQIGTLIIHRLNNHMDRVAVESASSASDQTVMSFVPGLAEGQAVIIGADLPLPLPVQIIRPIYPPQSKGADYQRQWRRENQEPEPQQIDRNAC